MTAHVRWIVLLAALASSAVLPGEAMAQRRAVRRPPVRSVVHVSRHYYYYRPYFYAPLFFSGFAGWHSGFWYPNAYPYYYGYHAPYPRYYGYSTSSARLRVSPRHAEVFVDGYFAGTVDDFDGWAQRLHVPPGEHELEIYLPGHRTYRQPVLFRPGATITIEHVLQPLGPGESEEARPAPSRAPSPPRSYPRDEAEPPRLRQPVPPAAAPAVESRDYGSLVIRVQPSDADVIVDGDRWDSPAGDVTLQLTGGTHRIEVRKSGYRTYSAEVGIRPGQTTTVNVSLSRE